MKKTRGRFLKTGFFVFWVIALVSVSELFAKSFTFGVVPQFDSRKIERVWAPVLNELNRITGYQFRLIGSSGIPDFEKEFLAGKFDFAYMNPFHLIVANNSQGYLPIVRDTGRKLYGIIVVRKDSDIFSVEALNRKTVAFPAPNALGASLIPRAEFVRRFKIEVTPKYVKSHSSVYLNVLLKQTDAGGGVLKTLEQQKETIKSQLRIIHQTHKIIPHPVSVHPRVPSGIAADVQKAFLSIGRSLEGQNILKSIPIIRVGKANLAEYQELRKLGLEAFYVR